MSVVSVEKDFDSLSLVLVADFDAPIERVWRLWADPRQLERWWGPPTHPSTVEEHDLATGGEVTYVMTGPGGEKSRGWWRVTSVTPPSSLEFTDGFANRDGTPNADLPTTAVRMRLTEHDGRTRMELRFVFDSSEQMEQLERWGAFEVFPQSVGQMDALLAADMKTMTRWGPLSAPASPPPTPCSWVASSTTSGRYWPEHADEPFGDVMNSIKKYVVSNSLQAAEWQNSEIISGDVAPKLTDIKARDGGDIAVSGSPTTVRSLLREVAVDELHLLVQPIVVGDGLARLFPPDEPSIPLELLNAQTFKTGVVNLSYAPATD